jgi:hypothetical protein
MNSGTKEIKDDVDTSGSQKQVVQKTDATQYDVIHQQFPEDDKFEQALQFKSPVDIESKEEPNNKPTYYLFIVKDETIVNIFELNDEIKLESTYSHENKNFLPNNYITSSHQNDFYSIFDATTTSIDDTFENKNIYTGFTSYTKLQDTQTVIKFYVYKFNKLDEPTIYYTHGTIYVYNYGIMSTCEIVKTSDETVFANLVNVVNVLPRDMAAIAIIGIVPNEIATANKTKYIDLITKIKEHIFSSDTNKITVQKKSIYIHYLNAILPKDMKSIFAADKILAVIQTLYVNISFFDDDSLNYLNNLHTYINYYYHYKDTVRVNRCRNINEYIDILEEKEESSKYFSDFSMHIFDFFEFLMFLEKKDTELKYINLCIKIYQYYYAAFSKQIDVLGLNDNNTMESIQTTINKNLKGVNTFLQIINSGPEYNEKFKIKLDDKHASMIIDYTTSTKKFYNDKNEPISKNVNDVSKYSKIYKFGQFNKIYTPTDVYESNEFTSLIDKITPTSPMMFSFHGPSGSGKSKVFNPVFLGVCKTLGTKGYTQLNIKFEEIFKKYDVETVENVKTDVFNLTFTNDNFHLAEEKTHTPYHKTHIQILNKLKSVVDPKIIEKTFKTTDTLETVLKYFLEEDRLIKGITTNYNSSRSHVLCFLEFEKDTEKCYVIFDDLVGNEKTYDCTDNEVKGTLEKFKRINRKIGDKQFPFYENEFDLTGEKFDLYNGGGTQQDMQASKVTAGNRDLYNKLIQNACEHRSVEGKFINDSLKDFRKDLEYIVNVKNRDIKYYVPDIYHSKASLPSINSCLQDFCFGKINCFSLPTTEQIVEPKSLILKSVYDYLLNKFVITDATTFYDKLELCIFGVLNISRAKNDPPSIHYIDINGVKSVIHHKDKFTFPFVKDSFKKKLEESIALSEKLSTSVAVKYVNTLLTGCLQHFNRQDTAHNTKTFTVKPFKAVLDVIDDENAKTAIGTLEFMNKLSKFNTVNSICYESNVNDSGDYKELYPK